MSVIIVFFQRIVLLCKILDVFVSESPPNEMVTPLKKRRLARESLSCEQNTIVPVSSFAIIC